MSTLATPLGAILMLGVCAALATGTSPQVAPDAANEPLAKSVDLDK
jgi:hypothetical protein